MLPGGTAVAHAGATSPRVWFVGAARPMAGDPDGLEPTPYSAEGATVLPWTGETAGPDLVALAEDGRFLAGRRASGLLSGTVARAGGTSLAAPQAARRLALAFLRRPESLSENGEIGALLGPGMTKATLPTRHARRGFGPLAPP